MNNLIQGVTRTDITGLLKNELGTIFQVVTGSSPVVGDQHFYSKGSKDLLSNSDVTEYDDNNSELQLEENEEAHRWRQLHFSLLQFHYHMRQRAMEVEMALSKIEEGLIQGAWSLKEKM